jgi:enamine deaminase RidA (YjgF/YER057c/UK114 family)
MFNSIWLLPKGEVMANQAKPRIEVIHTGQNDPTYNLPYAPAIRVNSGRLLFTAAMAAPTYHHHPHRPEEFDHIPDDAAEQARLTMEQLSEILAAAGGTLQDVVFVTRFIRDIANNQDAINRVCGQYFGDHRPSSVTVEVVRLATDPRLKFEMSVVAVVPE